MLWIGRWSSAQRAPGQGPAHLQASPPPTARSRAGVPGYVGDIVPTAFRSRSHRPAPRESRSLCPNLAAGGWAWPVGRDGAEAKRPWPGHSLLGVPSRKWPQVPRGQLHGPLSGLLVGRGSSGRDGQGGGPRSHRGPVAVAVPVLHPRSKWGGRHSPFRRGRNDLGARASQSSRLSPRERPG